MCILSVYSPNSKEFILTQNRDESIYRKASDKVQTRIIHNQEVIGPIDLNSDGTWIYHTSNYAICVLNGAYQKHSHLPPYRLSRGLVILELLKFSSVEDFFQNYNFEGIEPFTMVIIDLHQFQKYIIVWDGIQKFLENHTSEKWIVRSSSTLYNEEEKLFHRTEIENITQPDENSLFEIHHKLKMLENEKYKSVQTTSITQIIFDGNQAKLKFCPIKFT